MFLFWDLTSPSPPEEGGRKVRSTAVTQWDPLPKAISFSVASSHPLLAFVPGDCQVPLCSHQIAMAFLVSWSCPNSKLTLGWDLPPDWTPSPLKARSSLAPETLLVRSSSSSPQASLMQLVQSC